ncbi:hypothetical protein GWK47_044505 [Chionoecetes opilio]|uniref:Uncharacterized protein n=1 Tax=Chionoecetes opilio TaxID=41210 RepID=A0A8J5CZ02_CHIOP|nr:hypothetical protein GWK47_044505 [Chionoecetes opilio]
MDALTESRATCPKCCSACHNRISRKFGPEVEDPVDPSRWSEKGGGGPALKPSGGKGDGPPTVREMRRRAAHPPPAVIKMAGFAPAPPWPRLRLRHCLRSVPGPAHHNNLMGPPSAPTGQSQQLFVRKCRDLIYIPIERAWRTSCPNPPTKPPPTIQSILRATPRSPGAAQVSPGVENTSGNRGSPCLAATMKPPCWPARCLHLQYPGRPK